MKLMTRLTVAMVALVLLTATAVGVLTYRNVVALALPLGLDRIDTRARAQVAELETAVGGARGDVEGFRAANAVLDIMTARLNVGIDPTAGATEAEWRRRLALRFVAELASKPNYYEFRFVGVDDGGRELVRVDRSGSNGAIRVATGDELHRMGDRRAFKEAVKLPNGKVYVSPIGLSLRNGVIETPHVPVLRIATPVYAANGLPFGIVIINVDMRNAFAGIRSAASASDQSYVVNERGDYLVHADPSREFGFLFGKPNRVQDDFPEFAEMLPSEQTVSRVVRDRAGERFGIGWESSRLAGGPRIIVIAAMPYSELMEASTAVRDSSLLGGGAAVLGALALSVLLARSLTRPLVQMTKAVEGFGRGETIAVPTNGSGEIRVLAGAFVRMADEARDRTAALEQELSERKRAEVAIRRYAEREQLFIAAVESSNDAIVTETLEGVITSWNPAAERLYGFGAEAMIGNSIDMIVPEELRVEVRDILERIGRSEKVEQHETVRTSKDGRRIDVSLSVSPIRSPSGRIIGAAKVARDITEKKKAEEKLLESEQMARGIIAHALEAFIQSDEIGHVREWNPQAEAIFGWSRQEAVGQPLTSLFLSEDFSPRFPDLSARLRQSGADSTAGERFEVEAVRKDGRKIKIEVSLTVLRRRTGDVFNSFVRDLTERTAVEEALRQAQKMESVGQLTGGIAHDFNNMLTIIIGTVDFLADAVADKPDLVAYTKLISDAADRGAELTKHLLAFARKQPLRPRETDINALMLESVKLMRPTLGEHIEIAAMLEDDVWPALVDPGQLSAALLNLALNARDAMPNGGKLTLETANIVLDESYAELNGEVRPGCYVMIAISDTGTGIPEAIRDKVFEPFFSTKEVGKGTGLGLSMVYGFVKQTNGHVKIYSEVGQGTTFRIYLPLAGGIRSGQVAEAAPERPNKGDSETILVVEDDPLVRSFVISQLHGLGYKIISAANAAEAIDVVDSGAAFDLLFTDVIMPGSMHGRQLAEDVAKRRGPALKVLFTSGYSEDAIIHHGRLDPGVLLLTKPYRRIELARMVRVALDAPAATPGESDTAPQMKLAG
jgi:PAS domain S-box-containing protein